MKSVALHNLGCKVNSYEMDVMQQFLQNNGYKIVNFNQKADIYIINTCTVTNIADRKSRQMLHRAKKQNPDAIVVAVGCYVQTGEEEVMLDPCIDLAVGNNRKKDLVQIVETYIQKREQSLSNEAMADSPPNENTPVFSKTQSQLKTLHHTSVIDINQETEYEEMKLAHTAEHTRAYIKIQDGCNQFCSYCIIPYARGRVRSRKPENVLAEIEGLAKTGYKEVVITGIHLSSYGLDFHGENYNQIYRTNSDKKNKLPTDDFPANKPKSYHLQEADRQNGDLQIVDFRTGADELIHLLQKIQEIDGITRIRLGSLEPRIITEEFASELAKLSKLCPHFHLSLQSGCDSVLARMNRQYRTSDFMKSVEILRAAFDRPAITTDVITGFPGETEEEFAATVSFLKQVNFFEMHVFPYSKREGTVAATMPGQLTEKQKKDRSNVLLKMDEEASHAYRRQFVGCGMEVLFEQAVTIDGEVYQAGHTRNYIKVVTKTETPLSGLEVTCKITDFADSETLLAEINGEES